MPSPIYLLSDRTTHRNVPCGNRSASETITLSFQAIAPGASQTERPLITPEGGFVISFESLSGKDPSEQASDFELGKLYRLVPVEPY